MSIYPHHIILQNINPYKSTILIHFEWQNHSVSMASPGFTRVPGPGKWDMSLRRVGVSWHNRSKCSGGTSGGSNVNLFLYTVYVCMSVMPCNVMQCNAVYICMYVCMHVCLSVCLDVWIYGCMDVCIYIYIYMYCIIICANKCLHFNHTLEYFYISITLP